MHPRGWTSVPLLSLGWGCSTIAAKIDIGGTIIMHIITTCASTVATNPSTALVLCGAAALVLGV
jgi:hypothetical protein